LKKLGTEVSSAMKTGKTWSGYNKVNLSKFLNTQGEVLASCTELLYKNDVNGEVLLHCSNQDLLDLGLSFGARKMLLKLIEAERISTPTRGPALAAATGNPHNRNSYNRLRPPIPPSRKHHHRERGGFAPQPPRVVTAPARIHTKSSQPYVDPIPRDPDGNFWPRGNFKKKEQETPITMWSPPEPPGGWIWFKPDSSLTGDPRQLIICNINTPAITADILAILAKSSTVSTTEVIESSIDVSRWRATFRVSDSYDMDQIKGYGVVRYRSRSKGRFKTTTDKSVYIVHSPKVAFAGHPTERVPFNWPWDMLFTIFHDPLPRGVEDILDHFRDVSSSNAEDPEDGVAAMIRIAPTKTICAMWKSPRHFSHLPHVTGTNPLIKRICLLEASDIKQMKQLFWRIGRERETNASARPTSPAGQPAFNTTGGPPGVPKVNPRVEQPKKPARLPESPLIEPERPPERNSGPSIWAYSPVDAVLRLENDPPSLLSDGTGGRTTTTSSNGSTSSEGHTPASIGRRSNTNPPATDQPPPPPFGRPKDSPPTAPIGSPPAGGPAGNSEQDKEKSSPFKKPVTQPWSLGLSPATLGLNWGQDFLNMDCDDPF